MQFIRCISLETMLPVSSPDACVLCLGNFDGVHAAHQQLMKLAKELRRDRFPDAACGVFCFSDPPADFLQSDPPPHLTTLEEKLHLFRQCGMEYAYLACFEDVRNLSPDAFLRDVLFEACRAVGAICGFNFRFGKNGAGTPDFLIASPLSVLVRDEVRTDDGLTVSSTAIRRLLANGEPERAADLLTRPYSFSAPVLHGKALGRTIGTPTANQIFPPRKLVPKHGVYATDCRFDGCVYRGVTNVGVRPTVDSNGAVNCETYLPGFSGDLYGKNVTVSFLRYLREEQTFSSLDELKSQIARDAELAEKI